MKIKFETTVKTSENTKERMVCLDISENVETARFQHYEASDNNIEQLVKASIYYKFRIPPCICREENCGCWSAKVSLVDADANTGIAIALIQMRKNI